MRCAMVARIVRMKGKKMIDPDAVAKMAADYTAAWNSKSAEAVASFYAEDGEIIINNVAILGRDVRAYRTWPPAFMQMFRI